MLTAWSWIFWGVLAALIYVLAGYSAILLLFSGARRRSNSDATIEPTVSLIIPAHNEARVLRAKLENALKIDYPREKLEILVASDGCSDQTVEIAREFAPQGVEVLAFSERRGKASVLNDSIRRASGQVLFLSDANVMFAPDALRVLVRRLSDPGVGAVTGTVRIASHDSNFGQGEDFYYRLERRLQWAESELGSLMGVDGGMYVLRKDLFVPLPEDSILDDFAISMRVLRQGYRVVYEPRAIADENATPLAEQEWRRRVRVAAGTVQSLKRGNWPPLSHPVHFWQYVSHKAARWSMPWLLLLFFLANVVLWPYGVVYQASLIAQIAFYLLAGLATLWLGPRNTRIGGIAFYFTMSSVAMAYGQIKGVFNRQSVTWRQADRGSPLESAPVASNAP